LALLACLGVLNAHRPVLADKAGEWGSIKGQLVLDAKAAPERKQVNVNQNQDHCLMNGNILSDELVVNAKNLGVRYAFVWLAPLQAGQKLPIHPKLQPIKDKKVEVDQPCCMFVPHAVGLREGQELIVKNSAPVAHNVNWTGGLKNGSGNQLVPAKQELKIENLVADRFPVKIQCNIHTWMSGWVRVFDHPYFAVTDEEGKFQIKDAPAGDYKLIMWHEAVGWIPDKNGIPITIKAGATTDTGTTKMQQPQ
jgi:hypothetical protein